MWSKLDAHGDLILRWILLSHDVNHNGTDASAIDVIDEVVGAGTNAPFIHGGGNFCFWKVSGAYRAKVRLGSIAVLEARTSGFACGKQRLLGPARWVMDLYRPAVGIPCDVPFPVVAMRNFGVVQRIIHSSIALSILVGRTFQSENSRILKRWILKTRFGGGSYVASCGFIKFRG